MVPSKIVFLHITDMHIKDDYCLTLLEPLMRILRIEGNTPSIILVTGDIAQSGDKEQYEIATEFFRLLIKNINENGDKEVKLFFIPGNHDLKFTNQVSSNERYEESERLQYGYKASQETQIVMTEKEKLNNYYDFLKSLDSYNNKDTIQANKLVSGGLKINIFSINSAIFSAWHDSENDNDKNFHYFQYRDLQVIDNKDCDLSILLIHHSPDWYTEQCKHDLYDSIKANIDFIFYGHEHVLDTHIHVNSKNENYYALISGAFIKNSQREFSIIIYDSINSTVQKDSYSFNDSLNEYHLIDSVSDQVKIKSKNGFSFQLNSFFINDFYTDKTTSSFTKSISDIFVFPQLSLSTNSLKKTKITSFDDFEKTIKGYDVICVSGTKTCGKTTFVKKAFEYLEKRLIVVFLQSNELNEKTYLREAIDNALRKQYLDKDVVKMHYHNKTRDEKVCIIDNFDLINNQDEILNTLLGEFHKVIITSSREYDLDQAIRKTIHTDKSNFTFCKFQMGPFINKKREELIRKVITLVSDKSNDVKNNEQFQAVNKYVKRQIKIFNHNPYFIILYAKDFVTNGSTGDEKHGVFSKVFEADLTYKIAKNCDSSMSHSEFNFLCTKIAYRVYKDSVYPITLRKIVDLIEEHNSDYGETFDAMRFIDVGVKSNIINKFGNGNNYVFTSDNYFAYYVANYLLSIITKPDFKIIFEELLDNILVRINSSILLFFSFLIGYNTDILNHLLDKINQIGASESEIKLTNRNVVIEGTRIHDKISIPTKNDINRIDNVETEYEDRMVSDNEMVNVDNIFSLEVDSNYEALTKGVKLIKYIDIISKAFPDFHHRMDKNERRNHVETMFKVPNIISYIAYNDVKEKLETFKNQIYDQLTSDNPNSNVKDLYDQLESEINQFLAMFTIGMIDIVSQNAIDSKTIETFEKYRLSGDLVYDLEMLTFYAETMSYRDFTEKALKINKIIKDDIEREMLKAIIVKFIVLNSEKRDFYLEQKMRSQVFGITGAVPSLKNRIKNG